jgi:hypothetical protein
MRRKISEGDLFRFCDYSIASDGYRNTSMLVEVLWSDDKDVLIEWPRGTGQKLIWPRITFNTKHVMRVTK